MIDEELLMYSRQLLLPEIDISGQKVLSSSRVVVMGVGGIGGPVVLYLAASGIGYLRLVDKDNVDLSNLHRQIIFDQNALGLAKSSEASNRCVAINPFITVDPWVREINQESLTYLVDGMDLIIDCTDQFKVRFMINHASLKFKIPVVSGAALGLEGQITTIDPRGKSNPCYGCLVPNVEEPERRCSENGVLGPLTGIMGSICAVEALGVILNWPNRLVGRLSRFSVSLMQWDTFSYKKDPKCSECSGVLLD